MSTVAVVVDTNIFLHFRPLREFPWATLVGGEVTVVVCAQVIRELDSQKDKASKSSIRDRARRALQLVEAGEDIANGVLLEVLPFDTKAEAFPPELSVDVPDDRIVAVALELAEAGRDVRVMTDDVGPRLKCRALRLPTLAAPDQMRLPVEDETQKEIRRLKRELLELESASPTMSLSFPDGTDNAIANRVEMPGPAPEPPQHAKSGPTSELPPEVTVGEMLRALGVGADQAEVERFQGAYRSAYERWQQCQAETVDLFSFYLCLQNDGGAPAKNPQVWLHVAERSLVDFRIVAPDGVPRAPIMPRKPTILGGLDRFSVTGTREPTVQMVIEVDGTPPARGPYGIVIPRAPSPRFVQYREQSVTFGHSHLKHGGHYLEYGPFVVRRLREDAGGCSLQYAIHCDNLPRTVEGVLHLRMGSVGTGGSASNP